MGVGHAWEGSAPATSAATVAAATTAVATVGHVVLRGKLSLCRERSRGGGGGGGGGGGSALAACLQCCLAMYLIVLNLVRTKFSRQLLNLVAVADAVAKFS
eukprot:SAG31_NODE_7363_length_1709_cov_1.850932_1_plen_101_part_00